jgi:hypothetical protein
LATTETFLRGALFLQESLKRAGSRYPLVVLVPNEFQDHDLSMFDNVHFFDLEYRFPDCLSSVGIVYRWKDTLNKF